MKLGIQFGGFCTAIKVQLEQQGYRFKHKNHARVYQASADAIFHLSVGGLLSESQVRMARKKLLRKILKAVIPIVTH